MAKRKIVTIDEDLCNGCGQCVTACSEGALQQVDGKARLVKEQFCDGFGDCLGECPTGALKIVERDAAGFDLPATRDHVRETRGADGVAQLQKAHHEHMQGGGCPGLRMRFAPKPEPAKPASSTAGPAQAFPSELTQWPVQIHLVSPQAPYFKNRELVVLSTCSPVASADVHWRFIRGRTVVVGCPKLDDTSGYVEKLAVILSEPSIPRVIVIRMEVPCCGGLTAIVDEAADLSGRTDLVIEEVTLGVNGDYLGSRILKGAES